MCELSACAAAASGTVWECSVCKGACGARADAESCTTGPGAAGDRRVGVGGAVLPLLPPAPLPLALSPASTRAAEDAAGRKTDKDEEALGGRGSGGWASGKGAAAAMARGSAQLTLLSGVGGSDAGVCKGTGRGGATTTDEGLRGPSSSCSCGGDGAPRRPPAATDAAVTAAPPPLLLLSLRSALRMRRGDPARAPPPAVMPGGGDAVRDDAAEEAEAALLLCGASTEAVGAVADAGAV